MDNSIASVSSLFIIPLSLTPRCGGIQWRVFARLNSLSSSKQAGFHGQARAAVPPTQKARACHLLACPNRRDRLSSFIASVCLPSLTPHECRHEMADCFEAETEGAHFVFCCFLARLVGFSLWVVTDIDGLMITSCVDVGNEMDVPLEDNR